MHFTVAENAEICSSAHEQLPSCAPVEDVDVVAAYCELIRVWAHPSITLHKGDEWSEFIERFVKPYEVGYDSTLPVEHVTAPISMDHDHHNQNQS